MTSLTQFVNDICPVAAIANLVIEMIDWNFMLYEGRLSAIDARRLITLKNGKIHRVLWSNFGDVFFNDILDLMIKYQSDVPWQRYCNRYQLTYKYINQLNENNKRMWISSVTSAYGVTASEWLKLATRYYAIIPWSVLYNNKVFSPSQIDTIIEIYIHGNTADRSAMNIGHIIVTQKLNVKQLKLVMKYDDVSPTDLNGYSTRTIKSVFKTNDVTNAQGQSVGVMLQVPSGHAPPLPPFPSYLQRHRQPVPRSHSDIQRDFQNALMDDLMADDPILDNPSDDDPVSDDPSSDERSHTTERDAQRDFDSLDPRNSIRQRHISFFPFSNGQQLTDALASGDEARIRAAIDVRMEELNTLPTTDAPTRRHKY